MKYVLAQKKQLRGPPGPSTPCPVPKKKCKLTNFRPQRFHSEFLFSLSDLLDLLLSERGNLGLFHQCRFSERTTKPPKPHFEVRIQKIEDFTLYHI